MGDNAHLSYSLNITTCYYFLFSSLQSHLSGKHFSSTPIGVPRLKIILGGTPKIAK